VTVQASESGGRPPVGEAQAGSLCLCRGCRFLGLTIESPDFAERPGTYGHVLEQAEESAAGVTPKSYPFGLY
jgi:hypothetical protein